MTLSTIQGQIERVTFHNEENGFSILRLKVPGHRELVTLVGNLMGPLAGQIINATGEWITHPQFGEQFNVRRQLHLSVNDNYTCASFGE